MGRLSVMIMALILVGGLAASQNAPKAVFGTEYFKHEAPVSAVAVSPDGKYFISAAEKGVFFWDSSDGKKVKAIEKAEYGIVAMAMSADGSTIALEDSC